MSDFKEAGQFQTPTVRVSPDLEQKGGVDMEQQLAIRPPLFRLRPISQQDTVHLVSQGDISPLKLRPGRLSDITLPHEQDVKMGAELEFAVISPDSEPVSLYAQDKVVNTPTGPKVTTHPDSKWLLNDLRMDPEGLRFQGEVGIPNPQTTWAATEAELLNRLAKPVEVAQREGVLLLPVGLLGLPLERSWDNASAHPYIGSIHKALAETALNFDSQTTQSHVDLAPYGGIAEFGLYAGNIFNGLFASMLAATATSAPFSEGNILNILSDRERKRNNLVTQGGVQANIPVDSKSHLERGHRLMQQNSIPSPERAGSNADLPGNGSHKDTRPAKYTTGTMEVGPADMNPNLDLTIAQMIVHRRLVQKVAEHLVHGDNLPAFLNTTTIETRRKNRARVNTNGPSAVLETQIGQITVRQAWTEFFNWANPTEPDQDWEKAQHTIYTALSPRVPTIEDYFNPNSGDYLTGNVARVMKRHAQEIPGSDENKIRQTNVQIARGFMSDVANRLKKLTQSDNK